MASFGSYRACLDGLSNITMLSKSRVDGTGTLLAWFGQRQAALRPSALITRFCFSPDHRDDIHSLISICMRSQGSAGLKKCTQAGWLAVLRAALVSTESHKRPSFTREPFRTATTDTKAAIRPRVNGWSSGGLNFCLLSRRRRKADRRYECPEVA
ncbi:hypothetical protein BD289DRAFT_87409 [Coniella lustricola]|uniref:Uncharacterized protein n=1 Tax=Coniella lustricola TaxID=2025994 RepID=A0A2T2ZYQ4_9PEZI|nr:hypothetical protein BD289DRAFT_87409 [Coniella lustricola]